MAGETARARLEQALGRIGDRNGPGALVCLSVYPESARAAADASDARVRAGLSLGPLDGAIVSLKDVFDVGGEVTRAGSELVAAEAMPAVADAPIVQRLRAAGAVIVAKTNMAEFAFTGIGLNPHFGDPPNPLDPSRVAGGSTSGGAVAVATDMCDIAIGTDTGGSIRVPAALCGIVGFKPSKYRIPTEGVFPLSSSFDSVGPLARTVQDCATADAVMAGEEPQPLSPMPLAGLRLGVAQGIVIEGLDATVGKFFAEALGALEKADVRMTEEKLPLLDDAARSDARAAILLAEAYAVHRDRLAKSPERIDVNVRNRVERGRHFSAADYIDAVRRREASVRMMDARLADLDALVMPTTPIVAPKMDEVANPEAFGGKNAVLVRNTSLINFFDLCAISLPLSRPQLLPAGLMLVARNGHDQKLLRIAAAIERLLAA